MDRSTDIPKVETSSWSAILPILMVSAFLAPISYELLAGDAQSINYSFLLLVMIAPWGYKKSVSATLYIALLFTGYLVGILIFSGGRGVFVQRQTLSLIVTIAPILLLFLRHKVSLQQVGQSVVLVSVIYSVAVVWAFLVGGFSLTDIYDIKGGMREYVPDWPQRYVVILLFGFFLALGYGNKSIGWLAAAALIGGIIFFTFTRAAYLGIIFGVMGYWASVRYGMPTAMPQFGTRRTTIDLRLLIVAAVLIGMALSLQGVQEALRILFISTADGLLAGIQGNLTVYDESESTRIAIWEGIFDEILGVNFLFGTGSAGVYLIIPEFGSAHGQYMDVIARTGVSGLLIYLYFWWIALFRYFRSAPPVFGGLVAIFIFGMFHETTKLSYCGFLFYLLIALSERAKQAGVTERPN